LIGVVRHEVNTSAGNSSLCGKVSCASQAASRMQLLTDPAGPEALQSGSYLKKRNSNNVIRPLKLWNQIF